MTDICKINYNKKCRVNNKYNEVPIYFMNSCFYSECKQYKYGSIQKLPTECLKY